MEKKLEVKDLIISFRTNNGTVKAVRDISFDLYKGETLAIVGESGSGKSVTVKAILGILAGNSIPEGGEILYDGKDLMRIKEDDFHKIRGDKIAMIFQDPLSSLNPIIRIGRQMTEALLLKGSSNRRNSKRAYESYMKVLKVNMDEAMCKGSQNDKEIEERNNQDINIFKDFVVLALKHENEYNGVHAKIVEANAELEDLILDVEKKQEIDGKQRITKLLKILGVCYNEFLFQNPSRLTEISAELTVEKTLCKSEVTENALNLLKEAKELCAAQLAKIRPDFFTLGYLLLKKPEYNVTEHSIEETNEYSRKFIDDGFMMAFLEKVELALTNSHNKTMAYKKRVIEYFNSNLAAFQKDVLDHKECRTIALEGSALVKQSIDLLETRKDTVAYIFKDNLKTAINRYFDGVKNNPKRQAKFDAQTAKYQKLVAKGRQPDWKVTPLTTTDLNLAKSNILFVINKLISNYTAYLADTDKLDFDQRKIDSIDYLSTQASGIVHKITPAMAKNTALNLMKEVGIPEPRRRFRQYPFEFSGGMRQRIVIAIALAANPDILICDEPTTALDVTIQAQILELINQLKVERQLSVIFITHDLGVVANMADRVAVMYAGKIVEIGTAEDIFYDPRHPYTWALLASMPDLDTKEKLDAIPGTPPNMIYPPKGDAFAARNKYAMKIDYEEQPPLFDVSETHQCASWLLHPDAPKVKPPKAVVDRIERMKKLGEESDGKSK